MKNIPKIIFIGSLVLGLIYSCSDEFLEVEPSEFITKKQLQEASATNPKVLAGNVAGIYTIMFERGSGGIDDDRDFGHKNLDITSDILSCDLAYAEDSYSSYSSVARLVTTTDFTDNRNYMGWRYLYRIVRSANNVIDALGGNDAIPELDENKYLLGQAKGMRAYAYFYLAQYYSTSYNPTELILPIYTNTTDGNQPKSSAEDVYTLIIKDLNDAESLLENFARSQKNEVDINVVNVLKAYTYGAMFDYVNMKKETEKVINRGSFTIMDETEILGGFDDINTPGWIWGVDITLDNELGLDSWWGHMDIFHYSYQFGDAKVMDKELYNRIPADDIRKGQFEDGSSPDYTTSIPLLGPSNKFYHPERVVDGVRNVESDLVYMRIAEVYLLDAEAAAFSNDEAAARTSLKTLLNKRLPDTSYIDALSGDDLKEEIYFQTRVELFAEGKSYLAMKRNKATVRRAGSNHLYLQGETYEYNDEKLTLEIPQAEILNNPNIN